MLEEIVRYDTIQRNREPLEVTVQKITNLLHLKAINLSDDGMPSTVADLDDLVQRLQIR